MQCACMCFQHVSTLVLGTAAHTVRLFVLLLLSVLGSLVAVVFRSPACMIPCAAAMAKSLQEVIGTVVRLTNKKRSKPGS